MPLRAWWAAPVPFEREIDSFSFQKRVVIVLPEVFGVNAWLRSITDRLAAHGIPALAIPLFARTAPDLDLGYSDQDLKEGRRHKDATTAAQILADVSATILWLQKRCPAVEVMVVGFCFGGHAALLAATLPDVAVTLNFYGAGVSRFRPGGGEPTLSLIPQVKGRLICLFGLADSLIPEDDRQAVEQALRQVDPVGDRLRMELFPEADHGFMCDARGSFQAAAAERGWALIREAVVF
ncbi:dienelactone hydrolase family protein [Synechococcus sp. PROS-U-1]|uniref:dienelactone hydrolase family protein n=1 Tax=Synechococcus sp. PROS-U-1 TaxID=1400866 RepID=UPI0021058EEE|nr:dienelactone hydrolase family protein [Synechococcus sp. PROS-U-1]